MITLTDSIIEVEGHQKKYLNGWPNVLKTKKPIKLGILTM
jgi:hypothetical protein